MPRKSKGKTLPTPEEAIGILEECLKDVGVPREAVNILSLPYNLISPTSMLGDDSDQLLPVYVAVVKSSGLALFFPALGDHGIYQRWRDKLIKVH